MMIEVRDNGTIVIHANTGRQFKIGFRGEDSLVVGEIDVHGEGKETKLLAYRRNTGETGYGTVRHVVLV